MKNKIKNAVETYQCPGCMVGGDISCFKRNLDGVGCGNHFAGTSIMGIGKVFLGLPNGFTRLGHYGEMKPVIFESFEKGWGYDKWNVPVWKHLNAEGHTLVRGLIPRRNEPFLHIFLENCIGLIDCLEISQADIDAMD